MITTTTQIFFANQLHERNNPFVLVFAVKFIYSTLAGVIVGYFDPSAFDITLDMQNLWLIFSLAVILAPIFETLLFQILVIEIARSFKVKNTYSILFSGLLFAFSHSYNMTYILVMFIPGIIYALYYVGLRRRYGWFSSAFFVFAIHALYNLFVFLTK